MGVLAAAPRRSLISTLSATAVYALLVFSTAFWHEPWADEAQAWLLARDSSFIALWSRLLHYEGTPGLWHTLLFVCTRLHLPYQGLNYISAALGTVAAFLVFRFAPFAFPIRLLLPFTFFLAYQYSVVARSYALIPPLLFGVAALYPSRSRHTVLYAVLLSGLALSSMHGLALSAAIALTTFRQRAVLIYLSAAALGLWSAWPAADVTFVRHFNHSASHLFRVTGHLLAEAFTGDWVTALVVIAASSPLLVRGRAWLFLALCGTALTCLAAVVYGQVWHFGLLFLAWIFALWISAVQVRPGWLATVALVAVLAVHCFWTAGSVILEWQAAYSGSRETAHYLSDHHLPEAGIYGLGYASVAVQPYFARNIFQNFDHSYWDWSSSNHMIQNYDTLQSSYAPWVLVGYKNDQENYLWNSQVRRSGYRKVKHFEGNLIWQGAALEPESFDLYQRQ